MLNNLGERCNKILHFLMHAAAYASMRELAEKTGVSRRSVYYDVCNINDWLDSNNLPPLKIQRGKGIFIPPAERIAIDALADKKDDRNEYIFSPGERAKIIACYIIRSKTPNCPTRPRPATKSRATLGSCRSSIATRLTLTSNACPKSRPSSKLITSRGICTAWRRCCRS